jgi:hypothetical protein
VHYANQPLTSLKNQRTSKLWVGGSSPPGRAKLNGLLGLQVTGAKGWADRI